MCRRVTCKKCGKPSWAGCGAHVEMVLGDVPKAERCRCGESAVSATPRSGAASSSGEPSGALGRFSKWLRQ